MTFNKHPSLLGFVEKQLIPYFYSFVYQEKHGQQMPYGELAHDAEGLMAYYKELFQVTSDNVVLEFLFLLASERYRGHLPCPCGSGNRLRKCHGTQLLELVDLQTQEEYDYELKGCIDLVKKEKGR
jgi:hypothetical protein